MSTRVASVAKIADDERAVRDFVAAIEEARWHKFPVSVREFKEFADTYCVALGRSFGSTEGSETK